MGIVSTLKWLWDPRTEEEKRYETDPFLRYTQEVQVFINGIEEPFKLVLSYADTKIGNWVFRVDFNVKVCDWLSSRAEKGIKLDDVWYPPAMIECIELGKKTVEEI